MIRLDTQWSHERYNDHEVVKEIIIELGLIINSNFHYDHQSDKFEISEANQKRTIQENKDHFERF